MKKSLVILSDLGSEENSAWMVNYYIQLASNFHVSVYNVCWLANIKESHLTEKEVHTRFLDGGIDTAVQKLLELEKDSLYVLAFSIGGTIAWKAALKGLQINLLFAVSSTRLRLETQKPNCQIRLFYAENDLYKPTDSWFEEMNISPEISPKKLHTYYRESIYAAHICYKLLQVAHQIEP